MNRFVALLGTIGLLGGCGAGIPREEVDRCTLGVADGNDAFGMRQGPACRSVAERFEAKNRATDAVGYARRSCELEDSRGCEDYLKLVRAAPSVGQDERDRARSIGQKACAGMVVSSDGVDARPTLCLRTADLYRAVEPKSPRDAGRLYLRACTLGSYDGCAWAASFGLEIPPHAAPGIPTAAPPPAPVPAPPPAPAPPSPVCHSMRACVTLAVEPHNAHEVLGTMTNRCDRRVFCSYCPARGAHVDKATCKTTTLAPGESQSGRDAGLWFDGYTGIAYDCSDATDDRSCTP